MLNRRNWIAAVCLAPFAPIPPRLELESVGPFDLHPMQKRLFLDEQLPPGPVFHYRNFMAYTRRSGGRFIVESEEMQKEFLQRYFGGQPISDTLEGS